MTTVGVFGSTGSVGTQTLDLIAADPGRYDVVALAAGSNVALLAEQVRRFMPVAVAVADAAAAGALRDELASAVDGIEIVHGVDDLRSLASIADVAVNGVVGFAGLPVTLGCLAGGRRLALANKESLIAAGPVVQAARRTPGAELIPVDSEHAAIHMCLRANSVGERVERIQLTASGGPFRGRSPDGWRPSRSRCVGPSDLVDGSEDHGRFLDADEQGPRGDRGERVVRRASGTGGHRRRFRRHRCGGAPPVDRALHGHLLRRGHDRPALQSRHATAIGYALAYPDRFPTPRGALDWGSGLTLEFEPPDVDAFPCLALAFAAGRAGGSAPAWLSAANEVAVEAFLAGRVRWVEIAAIVERVLAAHDGGNPGTLEDVLHADETARRMARREIGAIDR